MAGYSRLFSIVGTGANYCNLFANRNVSLNFQRYMGLKSKDLEKLGIPPKPKKPVPPFFRFLSSKHGDIKKENPDMKQAEIIRKIAQIWATVDPCEKDELQKLYDIDRSAYLREMMNYERLITPEQKHKMEDAINQAENKLEKRKRKNRIKELGRPKKPPTGFFQYVHEMKFFKKKDDELSSWIRVLSEQWKTMTAEEKSKYKTESLKLMNQYKDDVRIWEEKMVRLGHLDVVRNRGLLYIKGQTGMEKSK